MIIFPNAKINLGLNILNRRDDGFHNLQTVLYPVKINDALEIVEADELRFSSTGTRIPGSAEDNLCLKAWHLINADTKLPKVHIHLHKQIPVGAGLGGGSADAAFCIRLLNEKFNLGFPVNEMQNYARRLGSDCAFFIENRPALASGKGDIFESINLRLDKYFLVLVMPPVQVSTARAYRDVKLGLSDYNLKNIENLPVKEWKNYVVNDFEYSVFQTFPVIKQIKKQLYHAGALYASMSGSGASVYAIFNERILLRELEQDNLLFYDI